MAKWTGADVTVLITTIPGRQEMVDRALASVARQQVMPGRAYVHLDEDRRGAAWARNHALEVVDTEWVAWLDDDDEFLPNHIKKMLAGANFSGADMIYTYAEFVGRPDPLAVLLDDRLIAEPISVPWTEAVEHSFRTYGNFIPVTNLVRTSAMRAVGGFPEPHSFGNMPSSDCEDYGLLLRLLDAGFTFYHVIGARTWRYHVWGGNTGGRGVPSHSSL